ncbi:MAG: Mrp/NBP35 family ATP-binding protein, partial [bacterium]|nr:Mrp/NBP35 family ATP-binding protein [bacterium]
KQEASVGLLDADIYGPNIPMMMGVDEEPQMQDNKICPIESYDIKLMSLGFITGADTPIIWRGPIVGKMIQQFLVDVAWGELDYLVIDLPPGTGDAQLTLAQTVALSGTVIVTTPQDVALEDVRRSIEMFRKVNVPILGIVENMSYFLCPCCGDKTPLFGEGGGKKMAEAFDVPLLGQIPILPEIREGGDTGKPFAATDSPEAQALSEIARQVMDRVDAFQSEGPQINIS